MRWSCETYSEVVAIRDGDTSLTYAELGEVTKNAAAAMIAAGVGPEMLWIWAPNCWQWLVASMGISRAVVLPVNTRFKGAEAAHVLNTAEARIVFIVDGFLDTDYSGMLATQDLPTVQQVIDLSTSAFDDFLATGDEAFFDEVEARTDAVTYDDIGAIMFTRAPQGTRRVCCSRWSDGSLIQRVGCRNGCAER